MDFQPFPKIPRLHREVIITEKLDGTNAQIVIAPSTTVEVSFAEQYSLGVIEPDELPYSLVLFAGSRNKWLKPGKATDNFGFAQWVQDNAAELFELGEGRHYGEWYGCSIQRNYDLPQKKLALFNTSHWENLPLPSCVSLVPVLFKGDADEGVKHAMTLLKEKGSIAAPGFMRPEGIVVYHTAARANFKVLLENDSQPKGQQ